MRLIVHSGSGPEPTNGGCRRCPAGWGSPSRSKASRRWACRKRRSHDVDRRQPAFLRPGFDLNRSVTNIKVMIEFVRSLRKEHVVDLAIRSDEMDRERGFGRAHGPNV